MPFLKICILTSCFPSLSLIGKRLQLLIFKYMVLDSVRLESEQIVSFPPTLWIYCTFSLNDFTVIFLPQHHLHLALKQNKDLCNNTEKYKPKKTSLETQEIKILSNWISLQLLNLV